MIAVFLIIIDLLTNHGDFEEIQDLPVIPKFMNFEVFDNDFNRNYRIFIGEMYRIGILIFSADLHRIIHHT